MEGEIPKFEEWCLLELFGHQRIAGRVTEQQIAGQGFIRVDVPACGALPPFTRFYGPSAIYGITPVDEKMARQLAAGMRIEPINRWELRQLTGPVPDQDEQEEFELDEADAQLQERMDSTIRGGGSAG